MSSVADCGRFGVDPGLDMAGVVTGGERKKTGSEVFIHHAVDLAGDDKNAISGKERQRYRKAVMGETYGSYIGLVGRSTPQ